MKISTEIGSLSSIVGEEKAIEYVARAGFDGWDFSMSAMCVYDSDHRAYRAGVHPLSGREYLQFARRLKQIGLDNGIVCNQSHAPHPVCFPDAIPWMMRAIECTAEAGGSICVIHPDSSKTVQENAEMYDELIAFADQCGVTVATENMWGWDPKKDQATVASCTTAASFCEHIDAVSRGRLAACVDVGHAQMRGCETSAAELIRALGHRVQAVHLHDNDQWHDSHQIPFSMDIDFEPIVQALADIDYRGWFTLEAYRHLEGCAPDEVPDGAKRMAAAARRLAQMYEEKR